MGGPSVIIIGGGIAGLSAGCYARMNEFDTRIFEMHGLPGGLCTAWKRKGFTVDGCIHWLVGSSPGDDMHEMWRELGAVQDLTFVDHEEYTRWDDGTGDPIVIRTNADRLEEEFIRHAPEDEAAIRQLAAAIRRFSGWKMPLPKAAEAKTLMDRLRLILNVLPWMPALGKWSGRSVAEYAAGYKNQRLRSALESFFLPEMPALFMVITFAWMHAKNAGYPIGGSLALARAIERRYKGLGGAIHYHARVREILVEGDRAVGVKLEDGTEHRADYVVSAADAHATIYDMLGGRYADAKTHALFDELTPFEPLILVGLGLNRTFPDLPSSVGGTTMMLDEPLQIGPREVTQVGFHAYNFDPTLAPEGKTAAVSMMTADYDYWTELHADPAAYEAEKERVAELVLRVLDRRIPGLRADVEMVDVATPVTFERYTGNWRGSFEGWVPTKHNFRRSVPKTLPGLDAFLMAGHWVEIGGGLPPAAYSGRQIGQILARREGRRFQTSLP